MSINGYKRDKIVKAVAPILKTTWCNVYGGENPGGARNLGGLGESKVAHQWFCPTPAVGRFRMECPHGHKGQVMPLCAAHYEQYKDAVDYCPRCNTEPPGHKCRLKMIGIS